MVSIAKTHLFTNTALLIYINDLAQILRDIARPVLFADDTSIIISNRDKQEFKNNLESVMDIAINWFQNNYCP